MLELVRNVAASSASTAAVMRGRPPPSIEGQGEEEATPPQPQPPPQPPPLERPSPQWHSVEKNVVGQSERGVTESIY